MWPANVFKIFIWPRLPKRCSPLAWDLHRNRDVVSYESQTCPLPNCHLA